MIGISIWDIDVGYRYGISDINDISIWVSIWNMGYRYGICYINVVIHHIDMVILDIDMGYLVTLRAPGSAVPQPDCSVRVQLSVNTHTLAASSSLTRPSFPWQLHLTVYP